MAQNSIKLLDETGVGRLISKIKTELSNLSSQIVAIKGGVTGAVTLKTLNDGIDSLTSQLNDTNDAITTEATTRANNVASLEEHICDAIKVESLSYNMTEDIPPGDYVRSNEDIPITPPSGYIPVGVVGYVNGQPDGTTSGGNVTYITYSQMRVKTVITNNVPSYYLAFTAKNTHSSQSARTKITVSILYQKNFTK